VLFAFRTISPFYRIPWNSNAQAEKKTLPGPLGGVFRPLWVTPSNTRCKNEGTIIETVPLPGSGIGTGFPFAQRALFIIMKHELFRFEKTRHIDIRFLLELRID
jgi:hypothetical protein